MYAGQLYAYNAYYKPAYAHKIMHTQTCLKNPNLETQKHLKKSRTLKQQI